MSPTRKRGRGQPLAGASGSLFFQNIMNNPQQSVLVINPLDIALFSPPSPLAVVAGAPKTGMLRKPPACPCLELLAHVLRIDCCRHHHVRVIGANVSGVQLPIANLAM